MLDWIFKPIAAITDLVAEGGPYVAWIFACGVVMWALVFERYWYFARILPKEADQMYAQWQARSDHLSWCARQIRSAMISRLNSGMTANLLLLRVLVPLSPLLGLIGTVSGMLEVKTGDTLDFECEIINKTDKNFTGANEAADDEMCILVGDAVGASLQPFCTPLQAKKVSN